MKRLITTSVLAAIAVAGITACNNGAYTATPNKDQASVVNPFDKTVLYKTYLGTVQGRVNGTQLVFAGYYTVDGNGNRTMYAEVPDDSMFFRKITITGPDDMFRGKKDEDVAATVHFITYDTLIKRNKIFEGMGISIIKDADNKCLGTIRQTLTRIEPPPNDPTDTASLNNMVFYLEKH